MSKAKRKSKERGNRRPPVAGKSAKRKAPAGRRSVKPARAKPFGVVRFLPTRAPAGSLITAPGIHAGVPADVYHMDPLPEPSVSASLLFKVHRSSCAHAALRHPRINPKWEPDKGGKDQDFGTAAHAALFNDRTLHVLPFKDFRSARAQRLRDQIREKHGAFLLQGDAPRLRAMLKRLMEKADRWPIGNPFKAEGGVSEAVAVWREEGLWWRARADRWIPPGIMKAFPDGLIVDYKTTAGERGSAEEWSKTVFNTGSDFQATVYPHGFVMAWNQGTPSKPALLNLPAFLYVVQEVDEPFAVSTFATDQVMAEHTRSKIERAFALWHAAMNAGHFPDYPEEVAYLSPPPWELTREQRAQIAAAQLGRPL